MLSLKGSQTEKKLVIAFAGESQARNRYTDLAENLEAGRVFKRAGKVVWRCGNCGHIHEAENAPEVCPAGLHPQSYFELLGENW